MTDACTDDNLQQEENGRNIENLVPVLQQIKKQKRDNSL